MSGRIKFLTLLIASVGILDSQRIGSEPPEDQKSKPQNVATVATRHLPNGELGYNTTDRSLPDGSFNPNPAQKAPLNVSPNRIPAAMGWRERYRPLLEKETAEDGSPKLYCYPFQDATRNGIGINCTYGSHLLGSAIIALWTNGRLIGFRPPIHYGLGEVLESGESTLQTFDQWRNQALSDPAAREARFLILGRFDEGVASPKAGESLHLSIYLLDRDHPSKEQDKLLFDGSRPFKERRGTAQGFEDSSGIQREGIQKAVEKLIEFGVARWRPADAHGELDLKKEMDGVAELLATTDSWTVMDGIDRALQLAPLFPKNSLPLQAASYGINELNWMMLEYAWSNVYQIDYGLRAYALAQLAAIMDPKPILTQLNWLYSCNSLEHLLEERKAALTGEDRTASEPHLAGYVGAVFGLFDTLGSDAQVEDLPDWMVLRLEARQTWNIGSSSYRPYFKKRLPLTRDHDFFAMASVRDDTFKKYLSSGENSFLCKQRAAITGSRTTLSQEIAALITILKSKPGLVPFMRRLNDAVPSLNAGKLELATQGNDFYQIRAEIQNSLAKLDLPETVNHPVYSLVRITHEEGQKVLDDPDADRPLSGFKGFEFTPAERLQFARRQDMLGPLTLADFLANWFGDYKSFRNTAQAIEQMAPDNAEAMISLADWMNSYSEASPEARKMHVEAARSVQEDFPLDSRAFLRIAAVNFYEGKTDVAKSFLTFYNRVDPFSPERFTETARLCKRYGYRAEALRQYDAAVAAYPRRFDLANERAWVKCQMGEWTDPAIRRTFESAVKALPGNGYFQYELIQYLRDWLKDYDAARQAAANAYKFNSSGGQLEMAYVEVVAKKYDAARTILSKPDLTDRKELDVAVYYTTVARYYLQMGDLDKAEEQVKLAEKVDDWQGGVILIRADLALARRDYQTAMMHYDRFIGRYGSGGSALSGKAKCLQNLGRTDEAIALLEKETVARPPTRVDVALAPQLMELYSSTKRVEPARKLMDAVVNTRGVARSYVMDTAEKLKMLDREKAEGVMARIKEIMAGPALW